MYQHAQWLFDPRTTVGHLSRLARTTAATGLWDACGGLIAVVCRKGAQMGRGLQNCPRTSWKARGYVYFMLSEGGYNRIHQCARHAFRLQLPSQSLPIHE
jgi:hypothetical protein